MSTTTKVLLGAAGVVIGLPLALVAWLEVADRVRTPAASHVEAGKEALQAGRYEEALAAFTHARELTSNDAEVQRWLMRARAHLVADQPARLTPENAAELRYVVDRLLAEDGPSAPVLTALGQVLARSGDREGAKVRFDEALRADPGSSLAHTALGLLLLARAETAPLARPHFEAALGARPGHGPAHYGLAQLAMSEGNPTGVVEHLVLLLTRYEDADTRLLMGRALVALKRDKEALPHLARAVELAPRHVEALRSYGEALLNAGRAAEAERPLRVAADLGTGDAAWTALGFALQAQSREAEALDAFRRALAFDGSSALALLGAGRAAEATGHVDDAVQLYRRIAAARAAEGPGAAQVAEIRKQAEARLARLAPPAAPARPPADPDTPDPTAGPPKDQ